MQTPTELLLHLVDSLEALEIPYALAGSIAATAYGEPRATLDIDVVVDLRVDDLPALCQRFPPNHYHLDEVAAKAAIEERRQFNIIHPASGLKIDLFVAGDEIERHQLSDRRRRPAIGDREASFSPPEDLILKKLQYYSAGGSDKHLRDIAAMLDVSGSEIDLVSVGRQAESLGLADLWQLVEKASS